MAANAASGPYDGRPITVIVDCGFARQARRRPVIGIYTGPSLWYLYDPCRQPLRRRQRLRGKAVSDRLPFCNREECCECGAECKTGTSI